METELKGEHEKLLDTLNELEQSEKLNSNLKAKVDLLNANIQIRDNLLKQACFDQLTTKSNSAGSKVSAEVGSHEEEDGQVDDDKASETTLKVDYNVSSVSQCEPIILDDLCSSKYQCATCFKNRSDSIDLLQSNDPNQLCQLLLSEQKSLIEQRTQDFADHKLEL